MFNYTSKYMNPTGEHCSYQDKFGAFSFEPMGFARVGGKNLMAVFRIGLNLMLPINVNNAEASNYRGFNSSGKLKYTLLHFSIGLSYRIGGNKLIKR